MLPNQTIFQFYEGLDSKKFSDLTGYNLNLASDQLKENIDAFYDEYNAFVLEIKKLQKDYTDAKSAEDLKTINNEINALDTKFNNLFKNKVKTAVPINAVFTDTVTHISDNVANSVRDSVTGASTKIVGEINDNLVDLKIKYTDFKKTVNDSLNNINNEITALQSDFNNDSLAKINKVPGIENDINTIKNNINNNATNINKLKIETDKIPSLNTRIKTIEDYDAPSKINDINNELNSSINTSNESLNTKIKTNTDDISNIKNDISDHTNRLDTNESNISQLTTDTASNVNRIHDIEINIINNQIFLEEQKLNGMFVSSSDLYNYYSKIDSDLLYVKKSNLGNATNKKAGLIKISYDATTGTLSITNDGTDA